MKIFYSGNMSKDAVPEVIMHKIRPHVMLTFLDFYKKKDKTTMWRFRQHRRNLKTKTTQDES